MSTNTCVKTLPGFFRFCALQQPSYPFFSRQFYPIYSDVKKSKETGNFEDFIECLKLYDKMENGTMMLGELEHILLSLGELLEKLKHSQFKLSVESH